MRLYIFFFSISVLINIIYGQDSGPDETADPTETFTTAPQTDTDQPSQTIEVTQQPQEASPVAQSNPSVTQESVNSNSNTNSNSNSNSNFNSNTNSNSNSPVVETTTFEATVKPTTPTSNVNIQIVQNEPEENIPIEEERLVTIPATNVEPVEETEAEPEETFVIIPVEVIAESEENVPVDTEEYEETVVEETQFNPGGPIIIVPFENEVEAEEEEEETVEQPEEEQEEAEEEEETVEQPEEEQEEAEVEAEEEEEAAAEVEEEQLEAETEVEDVPTEVESENEMETDLGEENLEVPIEETEIISNPVETEIEEVEDTNNTGDMGEGEGLLVVEEIDLPDIDFEDGEASVINGAIGGIHMYLATALFDDIDPTELGNQLGDSQSAAVKDYALHSYIEDKLNRSNSNIPVRGSSTSPVVLINLGNTQDSVSTGNNNPIITQAESIKVPRINRTVSLANWTSLPTISDNPEVVVPDTPANNATNWTFIFNFGADLVLSQGIQASLLPNSDYNISTVYNVSQYNDTNSTDMNTPTEASSLIDLLNGVVTAPVDPNVTYYVELQLINLQNFTVNASFLTNYLPSSNAWQTSSFAYSFLQNNNQTLVQVNWTSEIGNYTVNTTNLTNATAGSEQVSNSTLVQLNQTQYLALGGYLQVQNISTYGHADKLRYLMLTGANYVINQGVINGLLTNSTYNFTQINSAYVRNDTTGLDVLYRYDLSIASELGTTARMNYEVYYAVDAQVQTFGFYNVTLNDI